MLSHVTRGVAIIHADAGSGIAVQLRTDADEGDAGSFKRIDQFRIIGKRRHNDEGLNAHVQESFFHLLKVNHIIVNERFFDNEIMAQLTTRIQSTEKKLAEIAVAWVSID